MNEKKNITLKELEEAAAANALQYDSPEAFIYRMIYEADHYSSPAPVLAFHNYFIHRATAENAARIMSLLQQLNINEIYLMECGSATHEIITAFIEAGAKIAGTSTIEAPRRWATAEKIIKISIK